MIEINNKTRSKINLNIVKKTTEQFLKIYQKNKVNCKTREDQNISIAFVGDTVIQKLNKQYRKKDKITDVLTFRDDDNCLGEIIINYAQIKRQAIQFQTTNNKELIFILVHGLLHLIGYNDDTDRGAKKMEELGNEFITTK